MSSLKSNFLKLGLVLTSVVFLLIALSMSLAASRSERRSMIAPTQAGELYSIVKLLCLPLRLRVPPITRWWTADDDHHGAGLPGGGPYHPGGGQRRDLTVL